MKERRVWSVDVLLVLLAAACLVLTVLLGLAKPAYLLVALGVELVVFIAAAVGIRSLRRALRRLLAGRGTSEAAAASGMAAMATPVAALQGKTLVWCNDAFKQTFADGMDVTLLPLHKLLPGLDLQACAAPGGQDLALHNSRYTAYGSAPHNAGGLLFVLLCEDTALKTRAEEYDATRPTVLYLMVDTYEDLVAEMRENERAQALATVGRLLEDYIGRRGGFLRRVSSSRYLAVIEERHMQDIVARRFDILDTVRSAETEGMDITLSIGAGRLGNTFADCEEMALQALDMALGRGGDQAAVKGPEGFEFYGGLSRSVEKRTKVKSRVIAKAIRELVAQNDRVLIMGHKNSDMDCVGAAVGMLRFCRICHKPAAIVIDPAHTNAGSLYEQLVKEGYGEDMLLPDEALPMAGPGTLLIVVDTHMKHLLESYDVYAACEQVVVIDHHRRMVGHIENAMVFYHEPYASSASELVAELLQYVGEEKGARPTPLEAEALLAGIMLDTRTFALHVGVRTFEAAAYLRRMGAEAESAKRLFAVTMDEYLYRSHLVAAAEIEMGCAVTVSDQIPFECEVVAPQAANELLAIEGVQASFVAIKQGGQVRISARSMGDVNVQLVMEKLGGGGHLTMAGAQLEGIDCAETRRLLFETIAAYRAENAHVNAE